MSGMGLPLEGHGVPSRCKAEPPWQPEDAIPGSLLHLRPAHLCRVRACLQTGLSSQARPPACLCSTWPSASFVPTDAGSFLIPNPTFSCPLTDARVWLCASQLINYLHAVLPSGWGAGLYR